MPELPEVETMRRGILSVVGSTIADVSRAPCRRKPIRITPRIDALRRRARGRRICAVDRLGKRVVVRLDNDNSLVLEPRMTGLVLVADPPSIEHLRLVVELTGGPAARFMFWDRRGLGSVRLLTAGQFDEQFGGNKLGPDAMALSADDLPLRLRTSRRAIKVALLDQRAVAGIGNLYASEILHLAGVDPRARCDRLRGSQWQRIHAAVLEILGEAIRYEGSTLSDGTYRNALNQAGEYQNHHRVYDRRGMSCGNCGGTIERIVQAQRSTFFCRRCQKRR